MDDMGTQQQIGRYGAQIENLEKQLGVMNSDLHAMRRDVREIRTMLARAQGAWKVAGIVASVVGAVLGFFAQSWFPHR